MSEPKFGMGDMVKLTATGEYLGSVHGEPVIRPKGAVRVGECEQQGMGPNAGETTRYKFATWACGEWRYRVGGHTYMEGELGAW